jgi:hypothetical protein
MEISKLKKEGITAQRGMAQRRRKTTQRRAALVLGKRMVLGNRWYLDYNNIDT